MDININKSKTMIRTKEKRNYKIILNGQILEHVKYYKYLGIISNKI